MEVSVAVSLKKSRNILCDYVDSFLKDKESFSYSHKDGVDGWTIKRNGKYFTLSAQFDRYAWTEKQGSRYTFRSYVGKSKDFLDWDKMATYRNPGVSGIIKQWFNPDSEWIAFKDEDDLKDSLKKNYSYRLQSIS